MRLSTAPPPDITGQDKANPSAILMAFAMMLNDLGMTDKADKLNAAIQAQVAEGKVITADIGGTAGTKGIHPGRYRPAVIF